MLIEPKDSRALRQGDILSDLVFPIARISLPEQRFAAKYKSGNNRDNLELLPMLGGKPNRPKFLVEVESTITNCAVLSQCCDVDPSQNPPPFTFVLCRVMQIPSSILSKPDLLARLRENGSPFQPQPIFKGLFYLGIINGHEVMADFAQVITVDWSDYKAILQKRIFQIDDRTRAKFRIRAGQHLGRPAQEDLDAGLADPWDDDQAGGSSEPK